MVGRDVDAHLGHRDNRTRVHFRRFIPRAARFVAIAVQGIDEPFAYL